MITGGAGFIGSNLVHHLLAHSDKKLLIVDKLTYAGNLNSLQGALGQPRVQWLQADIADAKAMQRCLLEHRPECLIHLAAETHVDRSIEDSAPFLQTNVLGTAALLEACRLLLRESSGLRERFRFLQVSTDEVFGSLSAQDPAWREDSPHAPRSPYSASKAAADHLVMAWHHTHGLPAMIAHCCNAYGPRQYPEKLIPLCLLKMLRGEPIPVYGSGDNQRQWIHVQDLCRGLHRLADCGQLGRSYALCGGPSLPNLELIRQLCQLMDEALNPQSPLESLITHVVDRPGHDWRYEMDNSLTRAALNWQPSLSLRDGLRQTRDWYLQQSDWWQPLWNEALKRRGATGLLLP